MQEVRWLVDWFRLLEVDVHRLDIMIENKNNHSPWVYSAVLCARGKVGSLFFSEVVRHNYRNAPRQQCVEETPRAEIVVSVSA